MARAAGPLPKTNTSHVSSKSDVALKRVVGATAGRRPVCGLRIRDGRTTGKETTALDAKIATTAAAASNTDEFLIRLTVGLYDRTRLFVR